MGKQSKNPSKIPALQILTCLAAILFVLTAIATQATSFPKTGIEKETRFTGKIDGGRLFVTITLGENVDLSQANSAGVWITDLSKTPVALATTQELNVGERKIKAVLPVNGWDTRRPALYTLWFKTKGDGNQTTDAAGMREVLGSMRLHLISNTTFQVGTMGAVRIVAREHYSDMPLRGVQITANLTDKDETRLLFTAITDETGSVSKSFPIPDDFGDSATLEITAEKNGEKITESSTVSFRRDARIMLTSDKPLYQPGQVIHIRSLTLAQSTRKPIPQVEAVIEVEDAKGNKVFKKKGKTDDYGIFAVDFQLANELNKGRFRLSARVGDQNAEKTVDVKNYVLPKFKVSIKTDRPFYQPGRTVTGTVSADYIFGKPTTGAKIVIKGFGSIVGASQFNEIKGVTNSEGKFDFEMSVPDYLVGQDIDSGLARVQFQAVVTDKAGHTQEALKSVAVSSQPLSVVIIPESGNPVNGVANRIFVMVTTPDGTPAQAVVQDPWQPDVSHETNDVGLAVLTTPVIENSLVFDLSVKDQKGNTFSKKYNYGSLRNNVILLRTDRPIYRVGDTARITMMAGNSATSSIYLDAINQKQTVMTQAATLDHGKSELEFQVTPEMVGTLLLNAYIVQPNGNLLRDTKVVYVNEATDLKIGIAPSKQEFRPGKKGTVDFKVTDSDGHPVAAALGITIVDEAVFALQDMQPGFEKVFFTLEKELMKPKYEFHRFTPQGIALEKKLDSAKTLGYEAMLASAEPTVSYNLNIIQNVPIDPEDLKQLQSQVTADLNRINGYLKSRIDAGESFEQALNSMPFELKSDPWGRVYELQMLHDNQYAALRSSGPDKARFTADDITYNDPELSKYFYRERNMRFAGQAAGRGGGGAMKMAEMDKLGDVLPMAGALGAVADIKTKSGKKNDDTSGIRIRKFFPETLYNNPALITDANGRAAIDLTLADSITTWRIGAMANSAGGLLGSASAPMRVFQDFFVEIDFPVSLTRNDEVTVPVALYNYLKKRQTVKLTIEKADWFELLDGQYSRKIVIQPDDIKAVALPIRAKKVGRHTLTVYAKGSRLSDAVRREVEVMPDGEKFEVTFSDKLENNVSHSFTLPSGSIEGANKLFVKIYPGLISQAIEGLDSMLRMPSGCFEQTSSATYPNIMILDYMKTTKSDTPEIRLKAEGFINQGYQRLLSYEVDGGGFEWFGNAPAHKILTAYGLMEFFDMSLVYNVDPAVITRTQNWLARQQEKDGSWKPTQQYLDAVASKFTTDIVRNTAYISWALAKSEYNGAQLNKGLAYLDKNLDKVNDPYTLALMANAYANAQGRENSLTAVVDKLMTIKQTDKDTVFWTTDQSTSTNARGKSADVETTALVGQALLLAGKSPQTVNGIINYLVKNKDTFGNWYSTQATVFALKVLIMSAQNSTENVNGEVSISVNGQSAGGVAVTPDNADVLKQLDLTRFLRDGENRVELSFGGEGQTMYQVIGRYFMPWKKEAKTKGPIDIDVSYDKQNLKQDDTVSCNVKVTNNRQGDFGMVVIDVGVPPGFDVITGDLAELVGSKIIGRYETTARQVILYVDEIKMGNPVELSYRLRARFPVKAQTPPSKAYEYYNPEVSAQAGPVDLVVSK